MRFRRLPRISCVRMLVSARSLSSSGGVTLREWFRRYGGAAGWLSKWLALPAQVAG